MFQYLSPYKVISISWYFLIRQSLLAVFWLSQSGKTFYKLTSNCSILNHLTVRSHREQLCSCICLGNKFNISFKSVLRVLFGLKQQTSKRNQATSRVKVNIKTSCQYSNNAIMLMQAMRPQYQQ